MSIASTVAAYNAAQSTPTPVAKRGMVEREHRYSYLCGAYAEHVSYTPCLVSSVTRDGIVKEVRLAGQDWPLKRRDWRTVTVDSGGRITDPEGVARQLVDENGHAIEYHDQAKRSSPSDWQPASAKRSPGLAILGVRPIARLLHYLLWPGPEVTPRSREQL